MPAWLKCKAEGHVHVQMCFICMDSALEVSISSCQHSLCRQCAYQLCARGLAAPLCPFCRGTIQHFDAMPKSQPT